MPKSKPPYPESFRREAVQLVRQGGAIPDVAESLGVKRRTASSGSRRSAAGEDSVVGWI
jgi:transposase-like protein